MRAVNIVVDAKGHNPAAVDLTVSKVYRAYRSEVGEVNLSGAANKFTYYELLDDAGKFCGIYENYLGIVLREVP
ncbi:hypothetical protein A1m_00013 [Klebsiella phage VLCpiA1m]|nr:hypothetical protein A1m_00013 [Klebsiella phage VLCpiA1m]